MAELDKNSYLVLLSGCQLISLDTGVDAE